MSADSGYVIFQDVLQQQSNSFEDNSINNSAYFDAQEPGTAPCLQQHVFPPTQVQEHNGSSSSSEYLSISGGMGTREETRAPLRPKTGRACVIFGVVVCFAILGACCVVVTRFIIKGIDPQSTTSTNKTYSANQTTAANRTKVSPTSLKLETPAYPTTSATTTNKRTSTTIMTSADQQNPTLSTASIGTTIEFSTVTLNSTEKTSLHYTKNGATSFDDEGTTLTAATTNVKSVQTTSSEVPPTILTTSLTTYNDGPSNEIPRTSSLGPIHKSPEEDQTTEGHSIREWAPNAEFDQFVYALQIGKHEKITCLASQVHGWENITIWRSREGMDDDIIADITSDFSNNAFKETINGQPKASSAPGTFLSRVFIGTSSVITNVSANIDVVFSNLRCGDDGTYHFRVSGVKFTVSAQVEVSAIKTPSANLVIPVSIVENNWILDITCVVDVGYPQGVFAWKVKYSNESSFQIYVSPYMLEIIKTTDDCLEMYTVVLDELIPADDLWRWNNSLFQCAVGNSSAITTESGYITSNTETLLFVPESICDNTPADVAIAHPYDTRLFVKCDNDGRPYAYTCPNGLFFDPIRAICDWSVNNPRDSNETQSGDDFCRNVNMSEIYVFAYPRDCGKYITCFSTDNYILRDCPDTLCFGVGETTCKPCSDVICY